MRLHRLFALCAVVWMLLPGRAAAQSQQPLAGAVAAGAAVGFMVADEEFHVGFTPEAFAEFYISPRLSVRATGGWSRNKFFGQRDRYLEQYRGSANVVYNWEADEWHPFVTAGVGLHAVRTWREDVEDSGWFREPGLNVGAGVEYFARTSVSVRAEGTYYWVRRGDLPEESFGWVLSLGLKKYF